MLNLRWKDLKSLKLSHSQLFYSKKSWIALRVLNKTSVITRNSALFRSQRLPWIYPLRSTYLSKHRDYKQFWSLTPQENTIVNTKRAYERIIIPLLNKRSQLEPSRPFSCRTEKISAASGWAQYCWRYIEEPAPRRRIIPYCYGWWLLDGKKYALNTSQKNGCTFQFEDLHSGMILRETLRKHMFLRIEFITSCYCGYRTQVLSIGTCESFFLTWGSIKMSETIPL